MTRQLEVIDEDALREIGEIAVGAAGVVASRMLRRPVRHTTSQFLTLPAAGLGQALGGDDGEWVGAAVRLGGNLRGALLMACPEESAAWLADIILEREEGTTSRIGVLEQSALKEFLNILAGAYLRSFYQFLGMDVAFSVPFFAVAQPEW